jgi:O-antigen ligase
MTLIGGMAFCGVTLVILNSFTHFKEAALESVGRDSTFTQRTELWDALEHSHFDRLVGTGFGCFWETSDGQRIFEDLGLRSSHSGYMEIYVNTGSVGIAVLAFMLLCAGVKIIRHVLLGDSFGFIRLIFWMVGLVHNFSESGFTGSTPIWFCLILGALEYGRPLAVEEREPIMADESVDNEGDAGGGPEIAGIERA